MKFPRSVQKFTRKVNPLTTKKEFIRKEFLSGASSYNTKWSDSSEYFFRRTPLKKPLDETFKGNLHRFLRRATKKDLLYDGNFHEAVGPVVVVAQCFGLFPVQGILSKDINKLRFSWISFRTFYSILFIVSSMVYCVIIALTVFKKTITFDVIEPVIFNASIIVVAIGFVRLAKQWPFLIQKWQEVELELPKYTCQADKSQLAYKIRMIIIVGIILSFMEHLFSMISTLHYVNNCPARKGHPIESFFLASSSEIFAVLEFSPLLAFLGKLHNILGTFAWNFMDLFVMIVAVGISSKFKQLNADIFKYKGVVTPEGFWTHRRILYRKLCMLCVSVDEAISLITMISFSNNLYFICVQLLKSLNPMPSVAHTLYFYFSLLFLLARTLAVSLYSAEIYDESQKPIKVLRCVPMAAWCADSKRFSDEVSHDTVALTGMKFFYITRKLVLSVAGTIVTYELVLVQFRNGEVTNFLC